MKQLQQELTQRQIAFVQTREPGGTPLGVAIRQLLLKTDGVPPSPRAEALLYQADRAQHVETVIRPALARGEWVFSDRFAASSHAFQAGGRTLEAAEIAWLNEFSTDGLKPDLYILLDLTVAESARRLAGRPEEADRFEREHAAFHERVRTAYVQLAQNEPERWLVLDASQSPAQLSVQTLNALKGRRWLA